MRFIALRLSACLMLAFSLAFSQQGFCEPKLQWQTDIGAGLWAPATIKQSLMYFGADNGKFYAFDLEKQKVVWTFPTGAAIRSEALVVGGVAYFASDNGYLYALDRFSGKGLWRYHLGENKRRLPAADAPYDYDYLHSSPQYYQGSIFIGSDSGHLHAVDVKTGKARWRFKTKGKVRSTPLLHNNRVFVGSWDGKLYALDTSSGKKLWTFDAGGIIQDSPAQCEGNIVFGSRSTNFYALDAMSGKEVWRYHHEHGSWAESSPVCFQKQVYVGSSDALKLFVFDAASGKLQWSFKTGGWSWSRPAIIDSSVYISGISASPYYFEGVTLVNGLYAVSLQGEQQWRFKPKTLDDSYVTGGVFNPPLKYKNSLIVMSIDGVITALEPAVSYSSDITYLGSAGYMLKSGKHKILIDAPYSDYVARFEVPVASKTVMEKLTSGTAPFENISHILISHSHPGHFDAKALLKVLSSNKNALLFANGTVAKALQKQTAHFAGLSERIRVINIEKDSETEQVQAGGLKLDVSRSAHWSRENSIDEAYIYNFQFQLGGFSYLYGLALEKDNTADVDILIAPQAGEHLQAKYTIVSHKSGDDKIAALAEELRNKGNVSFLHRPMEAISLIKNGDGRVLRIKAE